MVSKAANLSWQNLRRALLVSLVLHALLLTPSRLPDPIGSHPPGKPLRAQLHAPPAPPSREQPPTPAIPQAKPAASLPGKNAAKSPSTVKTPAPPSTASTDSQPPDAADLGSYRLALARSLRRQAISFPAGPPGRAVFRLHLGRQGSLDDLQLLTSSGQPERDHQALAALLQAIHQTALPASLVGQSFATELTLDFPGE